MHARTGTQASPLVYNNNTHAHFPSDTSSHMDKSKHAQNKMEINKTLLNSKLVLILIKAKIKISNNPNNIELK